MNFAFSKFTLVTETTRRLLDLLCWHMTWQNLFFSNDTQINIIKILISAMEA